MTPSLNYATKLSALPKAGWCSDAATKYQPDNVFHEIYLHFSYLSKIYMIYYTYFEVFPYVLYLILIRGAPRLQVIQKCHLIHFVFLATLVALHSTPVSEWVSGQSFGLRPSSVAWSLRACFNFSFSQPYKFHNDNFLNAFDISLNWWLLERWFLSATHSSLKLDNFVLTLKEWNWGGCSTFSGFQIILIN